MIADEAIALQGWLGHDGEKSGRDESTMDEQHRLPITPNLVFELSAWDRGQFQP